MNLEKHGYMKALGPFGPYLIAIISFVGLIATFKSNAESLGWRILAILLFVVCITWVLVNKFSRRPSKFDKDVKVEKYVNITTRRIAMLFAVLSVVPASYAVYDMLRPINEISEPRISSALRNSSDTNNKPYKEDGNTRKTNSQISSNLLFTINYIESDTDGDRRLGLVGRDVFVGRKGDAVRLTVKFSQPTYAYIIAFHADLDNEFEVVWPEKETMIPPHSDEARYPPSDTPEIMYGLDEGTGLWTFLVVASSKPLPCFRDWRAAREPLPSTKQRGLEGTVWHFNHNEVDAITAENVNKTRGKDRTEAHVAPLLAQVRWAKTDSQIEIVEGIAFVVLSR